MKKYLAAFATSLAMISAPVLAQSTPAAPDPAAVAAVQKMFVSMKQREVMAAMMQQMSANIPTQLRAFMTMQVNANAKATPADKKKALDKVETMLPKMSAAAVKLLNDPGLLDEVQAAMVAPYARAFTVDEINELARFYATPLGQKMLAQSPRLMAESMTLSQNIIGPRIAKLMQELAAQGIK